jgi:hypothetical protein
VHGELAATRVVRSRKLEHLEIVNEQAIVGREIHLFGAKSQAKPEGIGLHRVGHVRRSPGAVRDA